MFSGDFWSVLAQTFWWILMFYIFFAFLMVLFAIFGDLFRDKDLHGGMKALWIFALIFFTPITVLIYLIVRGRGMAERSQEQMRSQRNASDDYIREVAAKASPSEEIARAKALLDSGAISADEYNAIKARALG